MNSGDKVLIIWATVLLIVAGCILIKGRDECNKTPVVELNSSNSIIKAIFPLYKDDVNIGSAEVESGFIYENNVELFHVHIKTKQHDIFGSRCVYDKRLNTVWFTHGLIIKDPSGTTMKASSGMFDINTMSLKHIKNQKIYVK